MKVISVSLPWIANLSVNHAYLPTPAGGRRMRPEVRKWQEMLFYKLKIALGREIPTGPITVTINQNTPRKIDGDNLFKIPTDAVKMAIGVDDKHFNFVSGEHTRTKSPNATIEVIISWEEKQ